MLELEIYNVAIKQSVQQMAVLYLGTNSVGVYCSVHWCLV